MLPDTRGVTISRYGAGNLKLGPNIITYSRLPGRPKPHGGTCPGATPECISICYAFAIAGTPQVWDVYKRNSETADVPPIPEGTELLRWHVSGDFDTKEYICNWMDIVNANPGVTFWGYTRAWRVPELLYYVTELGRFPNVQLFASMDKSDDLLPPEGWRRSWLSNDPRGYDIERDRVRARVDGPTDHGTTGLFNLLCPEEVAKVDNCEACGYCFKPPRQSGGDVTFIVH